jgi:hypothetical protein
VTADQPDGQRAAEADHVEETAPVEEVEARAPEADTTASVTHDHGSVASEMRERARRSSPQLILGMASDADPAHARAAFAEVTRRIQATADPAFSMSDATAALEAVESGKTLGPRLQIPADSVLLRSADMPGLLHPAATPMARRSEATTDATRRRYAQRALLEAAIALMDDPGVSRSAPLPYRVSGSTR